MTKNEVTQTARRLPNEAEAPDTRQTPRANRQGVPPPRLYVYFDAIIRHGSIRAAAEALRIASSALNRRVLDLEQEVGTILFDRLPSGVRLTAAGEVFAAHVRRTLNDIKQVGDQIEKMQGQFSGHVSIGSAESAAIDMLPGLIASFQREYPGARFTLAVGTPRDILSDLLEDRVDIILTHQEPIHHDVAVLARARMPFCALMRADHPLSAKSRLFINECQNFPIVLAQEQLAARALVDAALDAGSLKMLPVLVTNMFEVMKKYVRLTDAISFHFYLAQFGDQPLDGLVAVPLADRQLAEAKLMLGVRRGRVLPSSTAAVCEWLQTLLRDAAR
jgi:DNA-binding transcriptional LysR family regulator